MQQLSYQKPSHALAASRDQSARRRMFIGVAAIVMVLVTSGTQWTFAQSNKTKPPKRSAKISATETAAAQQLAQSISTTEWLGPLAPIALSPFFGIACLSGAAIYGGDWVPGHNMLLENSILKNEYLFWTFTILAVLTSLPRLTKVSKPLAQSLDQLEAYAGVITLLVVKFWAWQDPGMPSGDDIVYSAGIVSVTMDGLLAIAAIVNIIVVNSVKFFFEFLIWLTPVPFLDACFEAMNKSICVGLLAIYAFSPALATALNLAIFGVSLLVFRWANRRIVFFRHMVIDPILSRIWKSYGTPKLPRLTVFPQDDLGPFAAKSLLYLEPNGEDGWNLTQPRWFLAPLTMELPRESYAPNVCIGWLTNTLDIGAIETSKLTFSHRYTACAEEMCLILKIELMEPSAEANDRKVEFA